METRVFKRFYKIVNHTAGQKLYDDIRVAGRGHHDDGRGFTGCMKPVDEFGAVHQRGIVIKNNQIDIFIIQILKRFNSAFKDLYHPEGRGQFHILFIDGGYHRIIFYYNNLVH